MAEERPLTWTRLVNGIGSALIAYLVVFLVVVFATGLPEFGSLGSFILFLGGAVLAYGLYVFFERL